MTKTIRVRLTIWYVTVIVGVMAIYSILTYSIFVNAVRQRTEESLRDATSALISLLRDEFDNEESRRDPDIRDSLNEFRFRDYRFAIVNPQEGFIAASEPGTVTKIIRAPSEKEETGFSRMLLDDVPVLIYRENVQIGHRTLQVIAYKSIADDVRLASSIRNILLLMFAAIVFTAAIGGYLLARKSLSPIEEMANEARKITSSDLTKRLSAARINDEIGRLARVFNDLLERLNSEFDRQKRFLSDASHELRTPVSIIRGEAEVALQKENRKKEDLRDALSIISDVSKELSALIDDLFLISRADAGEIKPVFSKVDLGATTADTIRQLKSLAEKRGIKIRFDHSRSIILADESLLRRLLRILLDNAVKYNHEEGEITVKVRGPMLSVANTGEVIPEDKRDLIFERLVRLDVSRTRRPGDQLSGAGLGLAIAKWIVNVHGASISVQRSEKGENIFSVQFPN
ncbi:MAG: hypothetical protein C4325_12240 [Blastocatellia bacterium]